MNSGPNAPRSSDGAASAASGGRHEQTQAPEIPEDLYQEVVRRVTEVMQAVAEADTPPRAEVSLRSSFADSGEWSLVPAPQQPDSVSETRLSIELLGKLAVKWSYLRGTPLVGELADLMRLPMTVVAEVLEFLVSERLLDSSVPSAADAAQPLMLNERGRSYAVNAFAECKYVGPAPVSLAEYSRQCRLQSPARVEIHREQLASGLRPLTVSSELIDELGTALANGRSLLLYGDSGNGKTSIARRLAATVQQVGGPIYVPYAVAVDRLVLTVFDPSIHHPGPPASELDRETEAGAVDARWRRVLRPLVLSPASISPNLFDLPDHAPSFVHAVPLHVKANGGTLLLDNLGRQRQLPALIDRWLRVLEDGADQLPTGENRQINCPIEQLTIFATHLSPAECFDSTFLRRVRTKVKIHSPDEQQFREIFRNLCVERGIHYDDWSVLQCLSHHYSPQKPPKASDPRDLLDTLCAACRFVGESPRISEDLLTYAFERSIAANDLSI